MMTLYKGYLGSFEVDVEAGVIFGRVAGLRDVVTFQGETVAEAVQAFHDSVDDYLEFCAERGESPEKPFSGRFLFRMAPELHRQLAAEAEARGESINTLIERAVTAHLAAGRDRFARIVAERAARGDEHSARNAQDSGRIGGEEWDFGQTCVKFPGIRALPHSRWRGRANPVRPR